MGWALIEEQVPDLYAAIDEVECTVASALTNAVGRYSRGHPPETVAFDLQTGSWSMDWWWHLPADGYIQRVLVFQVEVTGGPARPTASAWVAAVRITEGETPVIERELWRSSALPVDCPANAAIGIRQVAAELSEESGRLDLQPHFSGNPAAEPRNGSPSQEKQAP